MTKDAVDDLIHSAQRAAAVMETHQTARGSADYQDALASLRRAAEAAAAQRAEAASTSSPGVRFMIYLFCILVGIAMPLFFAGQLGADPNGWAARIFALIGAGLGVVLARRVLQAERG